jgi:hypothetical protein
MIIALGVHFLLFLGNKKGQVHLDLPFLVSTLKERRGNGLN